MRDPGEVPDSWCHSSILVFTMSGPEGYFHGG